MQHCPGRGIALKGNSAQGQSIAQKCNSTQKCTINLVCITLNKEGFSVNHIGIE